MIETQAVDAAGRDQLADAGMDLIEHARAFHLQSHQVGNLEEAAVGERFARGAPMGEPPCLLLVQLVQRLLVVPHRGDRLLQRLAHARIPRACRELRLEFR